MIAKKAMAKNTGARGLRAILESILTDAMYEVNYVRIYFHRSFTKSLRSGTSVFVLDSLECADS